MMKLKKTQKHDMGDVDDYDDVMMMIWYNVNVHIILSMMMMIMVWWWYDDDDIIMMI